MKTLSPEQAQSDFDSLIDRLAEDGPLKIAQDGKDIAVMVPPALYEEYLRRQRAEAAANRSQS